MMRFDHLLNWVPDRDRAIERMKFAGFHVVVGGEHPAWGSHNALSHVGLPYIELIAVHRPEQVAFAPDHIARQYERLIARGGGAVTFAVAVSDLPAAVADLRERGFDVADPEPGQRVQPNGTMVRWRTAPLRSGPCFRPFLIEWEQPDEERLADLQARGIDAAHANGATRLKRLVITSAQPAADAAWCAHIPGVTPIADGEAWIVPLPACDLLFQAVTQGQLPAITQMVFQGSLNARFPLNGLDVVIEQA